MTPLLDAHALEIPGRLQNTSLVIDRPSLVGLVGPNGGGKTSLLRALAGVDDSTGQAWIDGESVASAPPARRDRLLAFLPPSRDIVWPIAARDVIVLGLQLLDRALVERLVCELELAPFLDRPVNSLSTGERSRVLIARTLAAGPRLLLLDEPLANLDPYWVLRLLEILRETVDSRPCAAIASLHDLTQANSFDRLLVAHDGRIIADGQPAEVLASDRIGTAFRILLDEGRWQIRQSAGRRSLP